MHILNPKGPSASRRALPFLLLTPDGLQLLPALLIVRRKAFVLIQKLFMFLHQTRCVLLVLFILVQFCNQFLPKNKRHTSRRMEISLPYQLVMKAPINQNFDSGSIIIQARHTAAAATEGEGNGTPLQSFCLENPTAGG